MGFLRDRRINRDDIKIHVDILISVERFLRLLSLGGRAGENSLSPLVSLLEGISSTKLRFTFLYQLAHH